MREGGSWEDPPVMAEKKKKKKKKKEEEEEGGARAVGRSGSVSLSEKEKKRRVKLSDSESDEHVVSPPSHRRKCSSVLISKKKSGGGSAGKDEEPDIEVEEAKRIQKNILGTGGIGRKRTRNSSSKEDWVDSETTLNRIKMDSLKCGRGGGDKAEKVGGTKRMKAAESLSSSSSSSSSTSLGKGGMAVRQSESSSAVKKLQFKLKKKKKKKKKKKMKKKTSSSPVAERRAAHINRAPKDNTTQLLGVIGKHRLGISSLEEEKEKVKGKEKVIPIHGNGGALSRVSPSTRKVGRHKKPSVGKEVDENSNSSESKDPSLSGERIAHKESRSSFLGKSNTNLGKKVLSPEKKGGGRVDNKTVTNNMSRKRRSQDTADFRYKAQSKDKGDRNSILRAPHLKEKNIEPQKIGRRTEKQKLRDQIKSILLNAGWKIDLRPRRGRSYEDSVYISPKGRGYWSITKAYDVFQNQVKSIKETGNLKLKESSGEMSKATTRNKHSLKAASSLFSSIPVEDLSILKRKVVNKRRSKKELELVEKSRDSGRKRPKKTHIVKFGRTRENGVKSGKRKGQRGCALLARRSSQDGESDNDDYVPYAGKRTILSWMIDSGIVPPNGKVKYMNKRQTRTLQEGWITSDGIHCNCCSKILAVSKFEIHAGSKLRQPYQNIYVEESGMSLLQCQLDAWKSQLESERQGFYFIDVNDDDPNDDTCGICGDGGDLICCDGCPSTFHLSCLGIQMLPPGDWHCTNCSCRFCGVLDCSTSQDNDTSSSTLFSCSQCEGKYHQDCMSEEDAAPADSFNSCSSFCRLSCRKLFKRLQKLLGVKNELETGFSWSLVKRFDEDSQTSTHGLPQRAEWNSKIAVALAVMDECFLPIIDQRSGINLIHNVLYNCGSNFNRLNYTGFYTFILEREDEIISAASVRIHGTKLAEMPFIGTRNIYRRQGMCRRLLDAIEAALCSLNIEKLVIPSIFELMHTWTGVFGFRPLNDTQKQEMKSLNMLVFPGTGLLQKPLLRQEGLTNAKREVRNYIKMSKHMPVVDDLAFCDADVHCAHEVEEKLLVEHCIPAYGGSSNTTSCIPFQSSDAPCVSDFQASQYKSPETAEAALSSHCGVIYYDGSGVENKVHIEAPIEPIIQYSKGTVHGNNDVEIEDAIAEPTVPDLGKVSDQSNSETIGIHLGALSSCFPVSSPDVCVPKTYEVRIEDSSIRPTLHAFGEVSAEHTSEAIIESSNGLGASFEDSGGDAMHIKSSNPIFPEFSSDAIPQNSPEIINNLASASPNAHSIHDIGKGRVCGTQNGNIEVTFVAPNVNSAVGHSGCPTPRGIKVSQEAMRRAVRDESFTTSVELLEPHLLASGEGVVHDNYEEKVEAVMAKQNNKDPRWSISKIARMFL